MSASEQAHDVKPRDTESPDVEAPGPTIPEDHAATARHPDTEELVAAALAAVAAALPDDSPVAVETGDADWPAILHFCCTLLRPDTGPRVIAIVRPPATEHCLASAWHARHGLTRVLLTPTDDPHAAMAAAAAGAHCAVLLVADQPTEVPAQPAISHEADATDRTASVDQARKTVETALLDGTQARTSGVEVRAPLCGQEFAAAAGAIRRDPSLLAALRNELARRVFHPTK